MINTRVYLYIYLVTSGLTGKQVTPLCHFYKTFSEKKNTFTASVSVAVSHIGGNPLYGVVLWASHLWERQSFVKMTQNKDTKLHFLSFIWVLSKVMSPESLFMICSIQWISLVMHTPPPLSLHPSLSLHPLFPPPPRHPPVGTTVFCSRTLIHPFS